MNLERENEQTQREKVLENKQTERKKMDRLRERK